MTYKHAPEIGISLYFTEPGLHITSVPSAKVPIENTVSRAFITTNNSFFR